MRTIKSLLVASALTLSVAVAAGCDLEPLDDDLEYEDPELDEVDDESQYGLFPTDEQLKVYRECMDRLEEAGATFRTASRFCKEKAESIE